MQIEFIQKQAHSVPNNGMMIADAGSFQITPALDGVPIVGAVLAGIFFEQARKQVGEAASSLAGQ